MQSVDIEQEIRQNVHLIGKSPKGWEKCLHTACDHGKKGPRASFLFSDSSIAFNCFNCQTKAVLDTSEATKMSSTFIEVLEDFGVSKKTIDAINFQLLSDNAKSGGKSKKTKAVKKVNITPKPITLPNDFVMLEGHEDTPVGKLALAELERRRVDPDKFPFMLCIKAGKISRKPWESRLVIPYFYGDNLIFFQGQDLTGESPQKYLNASHEDLNRSKLLSDFDFLSDKSDSPIYVVEGWYDAVGIDGVALFGNTITDHQITWLNRSYRDKVYIPDRQGDGADIALQCVERGWKIAVPYANLDDSIKDISDMVSKYGKLYTIKRIKEFTSTTKFDAELKIQRFVS